MKFLLGFLTFGLVALVSNLAGYSTEQLNVIYVITISTILGSFTGTFYSIFQAFEKMEYQSSATIISNGIMLALTLAAIYLGLSVVGFAGIYVVVGICGFLYIFFIYIKKYSLPKPEIDIDFWKSTLKKSLPFAITGVFVTLYFWIDSFMLSIMIGNEAVGIYNAAYRLIFVLLFIPTLFFTALFPVMSRHFESAKELLKLEYEKSYKYLLIVGIFIFIYGLVFANEIITFIYGQKFSLAIVVLQILICVIPIIFLTSLFGNIMNAINKQRLVTIIAALNALFNVALNLVLIPKYSFVGASVATVLTEFLGFTLFFYYISKYYFRISLTEYIFKPVLIGIITTIIVYFIKTQINWIIAGILGVLIYIVLLYNLRIVDEEDLELLKQILHTGDKND